MNKPADLLKELKRLRTQFGYDPLDPVITRLAKEVIQDNCKHPYTTVDINTCFYGTYIQTKCKVCNKILKTEKNW